MYLASLGVVGVLALYSHRAVGGRVTLQRERLTSAFTDTRGSLLLFVAGGSRAGSVYGKAMGSGDTVCRPAAPAPVLYPGKATDACVLAPLLQGQTQQGQILFSAQILENALVPLGHLLL